MKTIKVITSHDENYSMVNNLSSENHNRYCCTHNYYYYNYDHFLDKSRSISWNKIAMIYYNLKYTDYILWIDNDAIFTNLSIKIEDLIDTEKDFCFDNVVNSHWLNAGVFGVKNSKISIKFLEDVYNSPDLIDSIDWEQSSIKHHIKNYVEYTCEQPKIQSFPTGMGRDWQSNDYIFHAMRQTEQDKFNAANAADKFVLLSNVICTV